LFLIVGLGNIGKQYLKTRHNVGFEVVDDLTNRFNLKWEPGRGEYYFSEGGFQGENFILIKPTTYMNNSGIAVEHAVNYFQINLSDLLVICDDFNLPLGKIRLRPKGSDGGHNGLSSIIYHLMSEDFPRLRIGIGSDFEKGELSSFVLSCFRDDEREIIDESIKKSSDAVLSFITKGIQKTMTMFN
jgi:PTH1 family peptidyl-tRNA hydrolase